MLNSMIENAANCNPQKQGGGVANLWPTALSLQSSRRILLYLVGLVGVSLILAACLPPGSLSSPPNEDKIQLVYQDWRTDWFPPMAQQLLAEFHATHPNIHVFYTPDPENLEDKMLSDMQAGTASDVFQGCCTFFPVWAQKGYTLDLRPYVAADLDRETIRDWDAAQYNAFFAADGRQYGLPKYHGALALFYNKDHFDRFRVDYPDSSWDYDDYAAAMKLLTRDLDGDGKTDLWGSMMDISWDRIQVHVNAWGGHLVDPQNPTRSLMAEPAALAAVEWIRARIWDDRAMACALDVQHMAITQAFTAGRLAMVEDGSWSLRNILAGSKFRLGLAPLPRGPARRATLATTDGFGIYAGTKHPEAAWRLLKFLVSPYAGSLMAQAHFLQPARASLLGDWASFIRSEFPAQTEGLDLAAFADGHLQGYSVISETFANMDDAQHLADAAWQRILTLGQAPTTLLETVSQQIEQAQPKG